MAGVRKEDFEEELREEGSGEEEREREVIPAEEKRSYEREREGDSTVALSCDPSPTDVGRPRPSTRSPPARPPSSSGTPPGDAHFHRAASER